MIGGVALHKNEFQKFNVWTSVAGRASGNTCLISSHGGEARINGMANVNAAIRLHFYAPHNFMLPEQHFENAISNRQQPIERDRNARQSQDYRLAKAQYSTQAKLNAVAQGRRPREPELYRHFEEFVYDDDNVTPLAAARTDLVTIRRRTFSRNPMLSEVLTTLWQAGYQYREVYCLFCRGNQNPADIR